MSNSKVTLSYPFQKAKAKEMGGKKLAREHASPGFEEATYMGIIGKGFTRIYATTATIERKMGAIFFLQNPVTPPPVDHVFVAVVQLKKIIALMMDHAKLLSQMNFSFLCIVVSLYCVLLLAAIAAL